MQALLRTLSLGALATGCQTYSNPNEMCMTHAHDNCHSPALLEYTEKINTTLPRWSKISCDPADQTGPIWVNPPAKAFHDFILCNPDRPEDFCIERTDIVLRLDESSDALRSFIKEAEKKISRVLERDIQVFRVKVHWGKVLGHPNFHADAQYQRKMGLAVMTVDPNDWPPSILANKTKARVDKLTTNYIPGLVHDKDYKINNVKFFTDSLEEAVKAGFVTAFAQTGFNELVLARHTFHSEPFIDPKELNATDHKRVLCALEYYADRLLHV